jgi:hypothetical protein
VSKSFLQLRKQTPRAIALLLCLWLSGAFCVVNCQVTTGKDVSTVETFSAEDENLPPCHRKSSQSENGKQDATVIKKIGFAPLMTCCPFFSPTFEPAKNFKFVPQIQAAKIEVSGSQTFFAQKNSFKTTYNPPPRSRGSTYLKNRALLI